MLPRILRRCEKCRVKLWFTAEATCSECVRQLAVLEARRLLVQERARERRERWSKVAPFTPYSRPPEQPPLNGNPFYNHGQTASSIDADNPLLERRAAVALLLTAYAGGGGDASGAGAGGDFGSTPSAAPCGPVAAPEERQAATPYCAPESPPAPSSSPGE